MLLSHLPNTPTGGLPTNLKLFNGTLVNLTKNISTDLGLTNGSSGVVRQVIGPAGSLECVIVEFANVNFDAFSVLPPNCAPVFPVKGSFSFKKRQRDTKRRTFRK